jgi:Na+-transporting methylmalonyl-CoA/oxaloacetate decarboxylase gamma subunit
MMVGLVIVFGSLLFLSFFIFIYPKLLKKSLNERTANSITEVSRKVMKESDLDEEEIIAVITAAIAAAEDTAYSSDIIVRNIRRADNSNPAWNKIGRLESLN